MAGLQGISYGNYGYAAHMDKLADDLCFSEQCLNRLHRLRAGGATITPSGLDLATCISVCTEKVTKRRADYDQAKAEAI